MTMKKKKKKIWLWIIVVLVALFAVLIAFGDSEDSYTDSESDVEQVQSESPEQLTTSFTSNDGFVTDMDVIQVMAKGLDSDTGNFYSMTNFVSGKDTIIAVTLSEAVPILQDGSMVLKIECDGTPVTELLPFNTETNSMVLFTPKTQSEVGNWTAGDYTFTFTSADSTGVKTASFREAKAIKVLAVPVLGNFGGRILACSDAWKTAASFTRDCYPLAKDGLEYVLGQELDLSAEEYDLYTDEGCYNVWRALANLQTRNNDYELIIGFTAEEQGPDGIYAGYTYGSPANIVVDGSGDSGATMAHEIAHCYNVGDEYEGGALNNAVNTAPYGMTGSDWVDRDSTVSGEKIAVKSAAEFNNQNSGSVIYPEQMPFNVTQMQALANVGSFMGAGSDRLEDYWISSDIWNHLYKAFVYGNADYTAESTGAESYCPNCYNELSLSYADLYGRCFSCYGYTALDADDLGESFICSECQEENDLYSENIFVHCPSCDMLIPLSELTSSDDDAGFAAKASSADTEKYIYVLDITGTVYADGRFDALPWIGYEAEPDAVTAKLSGEYSVVFENAKGERLSRQYFDMSFYTQSNPPVKNDFAPLTLTVLFPDNASTIRILHGETELYSRQISANSPVLEFNDLEESMLCEGKTEITWQASDADGDAVSYELWYCTENDDYICLGSNLTEPKCTVDFSTLPGDDHAYFYLYATDGVNTSELDSPYLTVEYKVPEILSAQTEIPSYALTDEIYLDADVYDMQDGWLYEDDEVYWSLEGRPYITGSALWVYPYELSPGEHSFTLTAVNSQGKSAEKEFNFIIKDDETALPADWSRDAVKDALANGFIVPLSNIDSAITRGQYAQLMSNLYYSLWEEDSPDPEYEEGLVTDCGQDDFAQFLMVKLGVMQAENGVFRPHENLTEEEAIKILYQVCYLADPNWFEYAETSDDVVAICEDLGVLGQKGNNAYTPGEKITKQLALVRCSMIFDAVFED